MGERFDTQRGGAESRRAPFQLHGKSRRFWAEFQAARTEGALDQAASCGLFDQMLAQWVIHHLTEHEALVWSSWVEELAGPEREMAVDLDAPCPPWLFSPPWI